MERKSEKTIGGILLGVSLLGSTIGFLYLNYKPKAQVELEESLRIEKKYIPKEITREPSTYKDKQWIDGYNTIYNQFYQPLLSDIESVNKEHVLIKIGSDNLEIQEKYIKSGYYTYLTNKLLIFFRLKKTYEKILEAFEERSTNKHEACKKQLLEIQEELQENQFRYDSGKYKNLPNMELK